MRLNSTGLQVMREFRTGSSRVLITTDLLARGIGKSFVC
jgi:superfamily II DNA/RNA helicase